MLSIYFNEYSPSSEKKMFPDDEVVTQLLTSEQLYKAVSTV